MEAVITIESFLKLWISTKNRLCTFPPSSPSSTSINTLIAVSKVPLQRVFFIYSSEFIIFNSFRPASRSSRSTLFGSRWPYWQAWRCQRRPNSRTLVLLPRPGHNPSVTCCVTELRHGRLTLKVLCLEGLEEEENLWFISEERCCCGFLPFYHLPVWAPGACGSVPPASSVRSVIEIWD